MAIKKRTLAVSTHKTENRHNIAGRLTYGKRTQQIKFNGKIEIAPAFVKIHGHSVIETYNPDNFQEYARKGTDLELSFDPSAEELLELSHAFAQAAFEKEQLAAAHFKKCYAEEQVEKAELEEQIKALKKAFKNAD